MRLIHFAIYSIALAKLSRNEVLQYRGKNATLKYKLENPERKGESLCSILGCCPGVDLQCYGCHPGLLDMGIQCNQQPISTHSPQRRDCFCDTSCILFEDCCDDHFGACSELYNKPDSCFRPEDTIDSNSKSSCRLRGSCCSGGDLDCYGCNPVLLSKGIPCEQQTIDRQKANARDCFCDKSCILFQDCCDDHEDFCTELYGSEEVLKCRTTTMAPSTTSPTTIKSTTMAPSVGYFSDLSWLFIRLFRALRYQILYDYSNDSKRTHLNPKLQKLLEKVEHYKLFWANAERNCRLDKRPLPGEPDDGSFTGYNYLLDEIESETNSVTQKLEWIKKGFVTYMQDYYYEAKTSSNVQGCDGKKAAMSEYRGIMYKEKRYGRKMIKTITVIKKRVKFILKN